MGVVIHPELAPGVLGHGKSFVAYYRAVFSYQEIYAVEQIIVDVVHDSGGSVVRKLSLALQSLPRRDRNAFRVEVNHMLANCRGCPSGGNLAEWRILKGTGEEGGGFGIHAKWLAAFGFGSDGVEVDEPGFEDGAGHGFQRLVHAAIQLNFLIECSKNTCDGSLLFERWNW